MYRFEHAASKRGFVGVAGVDEAGRGPLAGPVVAACVILPMAASRALVGLTDSKLLRPLARERYFDRIITVAQGVGVGVASVAEIDEINILQATFLAMRRAIAHVPAADYLLVDGNLKIRDVALPQEPLVKGDSRSMSIAAASVIAKVTRDRIMITLDAEYPGYDFAMHKGYGTRAHYAAITQLGVSPHHRLTFLRKFFAQSGPNMLGCVPTAGEPEE